MTTLQQTILTAALDASSRGLISGTTNWAAFVAKAIKAALAQQGQEPVAYMDNDGNISDNNDHGTFNTPLYAAPAPQAQPAQASDHCEQHLDMVAQPLRELSDEEIRAWWASENGLEDADMACLKDFTEVVRAVLKKARVE